MNQLKRIAWCCWCGRGDCAGHPLDDVKAWEAIREERARQAIEHAESNVLDALLAWEPKTGAGQ